MNVNLLWLAGVCFIPLATVIEVGSAQDDMVARTVFIGAILVTMAIARLEELMLVRSGSIEPRYTPDGLTLGLRWIAVVLVALALVVTLTVPSVGLWSLVLAALARPVSALIRVSAGRRRA